MNPLDRHPVYPFSADGLIEQLTLSANRLKLQIDPLGWFDSYPLLFFHRDNSQKEKEGRLIAAGFHGDEPAGPWGVLSFLNSLPLALIQDRKVGILPLVNPTGLNQAARRNRWGEDPNRGFCHPELGIPSPSFEGQILLRHLDLLIDYAGGGFLSLHEDIDELEYYIYTFHKNETDLEYTPALMQSLEAFFPPYSQNTVEGQPIAGSVVSNYCDGSFEDLLFHKGIHFTACTETPAKTDFQTRVQANQKLIETFLRSP